MCECTVRTEWICDRKVIRKGKQAQKEKDKRGHELKHAGRQNEDWSGITDNLVQRPAWIHSGVDVERCRQVWLDVEMRVWCGYNVTRVCSGQLQNGKHWKALSLHNIAACQMSIRHSVRLHGLFLHHLYGGD